MVGMIEPDKEWQKRQVNALSVRRVRDGGFIVVEDNFDMGQMREVVFADSDISMVLQYVRDKLVPILRKD